jgi:hypothetical protein
LTAIITIQPLLTSSTRAFGVVTEMPWHRDERFHLRTPRFFLWRPAFVYFGAITAYACDTRLQTK